MVLLRRLCCFSLQNTILLSEDLCRKDRVVLRVGGNLQLFIFTFGTDSVHEKENSETDFAFNEDEGLFGDSRKSHVVISQDLEETSTVNTFFVRDSILSFFHASINMSVKHTFKCLESGEGNFV